MTKKTIGIIGGGIAGLTAAWQLRQRMPTARIVLMEANDYLGGILRTESIDGYLVEHSADMFTTQPTMALDLCQQLGHTDSLLKTKAVEQRAFIATPSGICPVPSGFSLMLPNDLAAVANSELLDDEGKSRFLQEQQVAARIDESDESLESFAVRRFGTQVFERLIQPLVSGIYTADPQRLSMQATMARFLKMEREHGSLIAAAQASTNPHNHRGNRLAFADQAASGARYDLFRTPQNGMGQLVQWIIDDWDQVEIRTGRPVQAIAQLESGWRLQVEGLDFTEPFDGLILATPSRHSGELLKTVDRRLAAELAAIETASVAIVVFGFDQSQFSRRFDGYGIVVPSWLKRKLIAVSFSSNKFSGRALDGKVLLRCFVGGALQENLVELPNEELIQTCLTELGRLLKFDGDPEMTKVCRWRSAMPQYHVGHLDRADRIKARVTAIPGIELAGNSYEGVGIPVCLQSGMQAAQRMVAFFQEK